MSRNQDKRVDNRYFDKPNIQSLQGNHPKECSRRHDSELQLQPKRIRLHDVVIFQCDRSCSKGGPLNFILVEPLQTESILRDRKLFSAFALISRRRGTNRQRLYETDRPEGVSAASCAYQQQENWYSYLLTACVHMRCLGCFSSATVGRKFACCTGYCECSIHSRSKPRPSLRPSMLIPRSLGDVGCTGFMVIRSAPSGMLNDSA